MKASTVNGSGADRDCIARLEREAFDGAVILTSYTQSALPAALMCYLAGIPLRLGHCRENPYQLLTDWAGEPDSAPSPRHEVQRQLDLVARVGARAGDTGLSFRVFDADLASVIKKLRELGIDPDKRFVVLHPGASAPSRRYPAHHWSALVRLLADRLDCPLVLTGSAGEASLVEEIRSSSGVPISSLAGRLKLGELGAALKLAALLVSNNTGPVHVAAAVGTPLVDLYALTNPQHTPWQVPHRVLYHDVPCRNCLKSVCPQGHHDCMEKLAPALVADTVWELLGQPAARYG
jgi:lipopolysaccharide heptosyltransferase II